MVEGVEPGERGVGRSGMFSRMAVALFGMCAWCAEESHTVPHVPSASSEGHAGVVRIESRSAVAGEVRIMAVDDAGQRLEAGRLTLGAGAAVEFEIGAMESGDASLSLAGTGPGQGDWRLELTTELDIEARAYARSEGFLTALHDAAPLTGEVELPFFNPGGAARRSVLRLANAGGERARLTVRGVDDAGRAGGAVTVELAAWEARGYTASELESGAASGLTGSLGDGEGKWRLRLEAERGTAYVTNLLLDGSGVLSSVPGGMSRGSGGLHRVSLFPSASDGSGRRGEVRVVNRSPGSAEVSIDAFDATDRAYEELRLALGAESSGQFDSTDLERGNAENGLAGSTGPGEGDWWLELSSASDIEVLSYVDTASGPLSGVRGTVGRETATGMRYEAVLLAGESGELRLLNAGGAAVEVRVTGTDDAGASGGQVELTLAPWASRTLTATALEEGEAGLRGALGSGTGGWRLSLESDGEIDVLSLVRGAGGMLSDVSRRGRPAGAPPRTEVIDASASGADLWVAASASEVELSPGEAFDLTATVGNVGDHRASATTLRYRRSADAAITTGDTEVGTEPVAALAAAQSIARSLSLSAPTVPGTYHYGACVDAVPERVHHGEQLLGGGGGDGGGAAGPRGGGSGAGRGGGARRELESAGDGAQCRRRGLAGDDAALLPVVGREHLDLGCGSGHGCGGRAGGGGGRRRVADAERADGAGHVPLRGVRGRGGGRVGYVEQLLFAGDTRCPAANRPEPDHHGVLAGWRGGVQPGAPLLPDRRRDTERRHRAFLWLDNRPPLPLHRPGGRFRG